MSSIITACGRAFLFSLLAVIAAGCGTSNDQSGFDPDTQKHIADWVRIKHSSVARADISSCTECHGADLQGGISGVSCESCHNNGLSALSGCTSCHGRPPAGSAAPNRNGAHAVHNTFTGVTNVCDTCHAGAGTTTAKHFNGAADVLFLGAYNSSSGTATRNADGTCSNVSCHGGQTTPGWHSETIDVNTQCTQCHAFGTGEYNSYSSGAHSFHAGISNCWACHSPSILAESHFTTLNTQTLNGFVADTIASSAITTYDPSGNKSCVAVCHASNPKNWL
jgi:predicted CxxxxCH...CXXCH cytochrome family protein